MRDFDFIVSPAKLLTPEIVQMVSSIHEHKGKQELFLEANVDELKTLLEVALIQSTGASNRIEGIFTSDKRLEELVSQKAEPRNRSEQEIAGYREVLSTIYEGYEYINPRPNIILQLHRDLYSYSQGGAGGSYKNSDNVIAETDAEGHQKARFIPVPAFQTAEAMEELCARFLEAWEADRIDKLVLIPMFILDFLCIHPFNDGNGRMSRLLTLLLFYKAGYIVGKYVSMEMLIEKTKETFGTVDVLVNNAGISVSGLFMYITPEQEELIWKVNVQGTYNCTRSALPFMINAKSGKIINISSMWGQTGASCEVHYSASKAAIIGFTKALAKELGPSGINVNCIAPGVILTDMNNSYSEETMESLKNEAPLERLGKPEDIAESISFLASEKSSFITGQILGVNGGFII